MSLSRRRFLGTIVRTGVGLALGPVGCAIQPKRHPRRFRLLFYTDVHATTERGAPQALERAVEAINNQPADLIVNGGDLIHGGFHASESVADRRWSIYMSMHNAIDGEIYPTLGNHDLVGVQPSNGTAPNADPRSLFRSRLGLDQTYYALDALGYHLIVLDSVSINDEGTDYDGLVGPEQMEWLNEDLSRISTSTPIVVVTHMPLLTSLYAATKGATWPAPSNRVIVNNVEVLKLFERHNLVLVLQGHLHVNELIRWRNTTFVTGGAVCGRWWRGAHLGTKPGFGVATLDGDQVTWVYLDYAWKSRCLS